MAHQKVARRAVMQAALAAPLGALQSQKVDAGLVQRENRRPGALNWQLTNVRLEKQGAFRAPDIEGYCSRQSVEAGDTLSVMVSAQPACRFTLEIFRMGYYGG